MRMKDNPGHDAPDMGVTDETFVYRNEITRLKQEREGHISHVALRKASIKQAGQETDAAQERVKELEDALRPFAKEFTDWDGVGVYDSMSIDEMYGHDPDEWGKLTFGDLRRAAALLEKK